MFEIDTRVLELCVLIAIDKEDTYGYKLTQELSDEFNISNNPNHLTFKLIMLYVI